MNSSRRPNFIFIVADDLGSADLSCYGGPAGVSPHLDKLAREGILYTRAYANSPVCSPTRFALITGRWQYRLRGAAEEPLGGKPHVGLPPSHPTLPSLLRDAGYATALAGKWHLGAAPLFGPLLSGYQEFFGPMGGAVDYFSHLNLNGARDLWDGEARSDAQGYLTDLITERAVEFVSRDRGDTPFFLSVHYTAPHWPWESREDEAESRRIGSGIAHVDGGSIATYHRMIHHMDEGIGKIVAALPPHCRDNTLLVFVSDNGGERYSNNWPFIGGKMDLMEGGIRVPQIAWWPAGITPGSRCDSPTLSMDWAATLLEAAGVAADPGHPLDGISLAPSFRSPGWDCPRPLFWRMKHRSQAAVLADGWKYLRVEQDEYLFRIQDDPRERANLAARFPAKLDELRALWAGWAGTMPGIPDDASVHVEWGEKELPRATH